MRSAFAPLARVAVWRARVAQLALVALVVATSGGCCVAHLAAASIAPSGDFDAAAVPRAPDYAHDDAWLALPTTLDAADTALADVAAIDQGSARVDVFYVHSTSSVRAEWNAPTDDPEIRAASIRGGTLIQGSVFNACCAVYAPEYRQASGEAFVHPSPSGQRAIDVAYADVAAAFDAFLVRTMQANVTGGAPRPFIVAAHSQGAVLATRLLRERIASAPERERLVAAYLIGAPVTARDLGAAGGDVPLCANPDQTGCVITFNARGPDHERSVLDFGDSVPERERLCVNPVLGRASGEEAPRGRHAGAVFFDAERPELLPHFASSRCEGGRLVVTELGDLPKRDAMSGVLLWVLGGQNYHPIEVQLFYMDLRADAQRRTRSFTGR
jgi:hypothetical protein